MLHIEHSQKADALYIHFSEKEVFTTKAVSNDISFDIAKDGTLVGIDVQCVSQFRQPVGLARKGQLPNPTSVGVQLVTA